MAKSHHTPDSSSSIFAQTSSRLPDDTVFYSIFPDSAVSAVADIYSTLQSLHLQILDSIRPFTSSYIWQHEPFSLSISLSSCIYSRQPLPHLHGKLRFGDNLEDEWFTVFLLFRISAAFSSLSIRVWDTDGEFLLIESAFHLPRWINPETSVNRVFIRGGDLHIVHRNHLPNPTLTDSLRYIVERGRESRAVDSVQVAVKNRISEYPERAEKNVHRVRVRIPVSVAQVLKHEPCLVSLAVEGFYERDVDAMKFAEKMERFLGNGREEELVQVSVMMSRAMYAQLVQQKFRAPKWYPMPSISQQEAYMEAELGLKIACGFEMMYQQRKKEGEEGKGSTWSKYKESLENSGYFEGLVSGSKDYKRLMETAEEYFKNSSLFSRSREIMSAPLKRIDEILALPHSADDFKDQEVPASDEDSWLYDGEDELNSALQERDREMKLYDMKKKHKGKETEDTGVSSSASIDEFSLSDLAKTMQQFVQKVSSYKGAEVPENRDLKDVELDADRFFKDMESVMRLHDHGETAYVDDDDEGGSSSDMDFDDFEDESDTGEDDEDRRDTFIDSYSEAMSNELNKTTLKKSFISANEQSSNKNAGTATSEVKEDTDADFSPVDVDINLVKSLLDSFSSQQGLPGPASNLFGLMGMQIPKDTKKG